MGTSTYGNVWVGMLLDVDCSRKRSLKVLSRGAVRLELSKWFKDQNMFIKMNGGVAYNGICSSGNDRCDKVGNGMSNIDPPPLPKSGMRSFQSLSYPAMLWLSGSLELK
jgi:hypothetical protein